MQSNEKYLNINTNVCRQTFRIFLPQFSAFILILKWENIEKGFWDELGTKFVRDTLWVFIMKIESLQNLIELRALIMRKFPIREKFSFDF